MSASVIQSVNPGSTPGGVTIGGITYFAAADGAHGNELWRTDGTAAGTSLVADLSPGPTGSYPSHLINFNGTLYFGAAGAIYKTNGTAAGTTALAQVSVASDFTQAGNQLYFFGNDASGNEQVYRTDGTAAGTVAIQAVSFGNSPIGPTARPSMANLDGTLYFSDAKLWKVDPDGHAELINSFGNPALPEGDLVAFDHDLYYKAADPGNVSQLDLWASDGTPAGTTVFWPNVDALTPPNYGLYAAGGSLYFVTAPSSATEQLYRTDGTVAGTILLATVNGIDGFGDFTVAPDRVYFVARGGSSNSNGPTLWTTDGTPAGTRPIDASIAATNDLFSQSSLLSANGTLYFVGYTSGQASELYETDGTTVGVADPTEPAAGWTAINLLGQAANGLVFSGFDSQNAEQLWALSAQAGSPPPSPPAPPSALVPTLGRVSLAPQAVAGSNLRAGVPVVVTNGGTPLKGNVTVDLFAETGTTLDGNQVLLASTTRHVSLRANQRSSFAFGIKSLPASLPGGMYHLIAQVTDPAGDTNAVATAQTVQVSAPFVQPSASIGAIVPATLAPGHAGSVVVTVANQGNVPSTAGQITLSLTSSDSNATNVTLVTVHPNMALPAGKSRRFRVRFMLPAALAPGSYVPAAIVTLNGVSTTAASDLTLTVT